MKITNALSFLLLVEATEAQRRRLKTGMGNTPRPPSPAPPSPTASPGVVEAQCVPPTNPADCADTRSAFPYMGQDNSQRLLMREGVIPMIQPSLCGLPDRKNVILVVGDGMGWEMVRAGAIGKQVVDELESLGCDTRAGCTGDTADAAMAAFAGRTLADYYTEGKSRALAHDIHRTTEPP